VARACVVSGIPMLLVAVTYCPPTWAAFVPTRYEAPSTATPPNIDGDLTDEVWSGALEIRQFYAYKSGGAPAASEGSARILWDQNNLYLGLQMIDDNILPSTVVSGRGGFDGPLYEGDVIELFVRQSANSPRYHEFEWSPNGDVFDARFDSVRFGPPGTAWNSGVQSAVQVDGTIDDATDTDRSWTIEVAIPLTAFDPIDDQSEWFFTVARYDYFAQGNGFDSNLMMSTPGDPDAPMGGVTQGFHTYEIYDIVAFVPEPSVTTLTIVAMLWIGFGMRGERSRRGPHRVDP